MVQSQAQLKGLEVGTFIDQLDRMQSKAKGWVSSRKMEVYDYNFKRQYSKVEKNIKDLEEYTKNDPTCCGTSITIT